MKIKNLSTNQLNQNGYSKNMQTQGKIGALFTFPINHTPEDCLSCDGYLLLIADYKELYKLLGTFFNQVDDPEGTFRVPDYNITGRFLQPNSNVGVQIEAGLPNITGEFGKTQTITNDSFGNGAFTAVYDAWVGDANNGATNLYHWTFDASRSSSIYGNSNTVQPKSQTVHICIKYK